MISEKMKPFMANNSAIRAMFEEGKRMAAVYGRENVYDFSLGNPNVPVPQVTEAILDVVKNEDFMTLHGYMIRFLKEKFVPNRLFKDSAMV